MEKKSRQLTKPLDMQAWTRHLTMRRRLILLLMGLGALLFIAIAIAGYLFYRSGLEPERIDVTPPASLSELATQYPELGAVLQDPELDSVYKDFLMAYEKGGLDAAVELARKRGLLTANDELRLTLEMDSPASVPGMVAQLEMLGIRVTAMAENLMDIAMPLELIEQLAEEQDLGPFFAQLTGLEHVVKIRMPRKPVQDYVGSIETESLSVINATAWHATGYTGKGIKIGVLDGGFDGYKSLLGSELPASVTVQSFAAGREADDLGTEHGTAVAEIIHDIAPDAELFFAAFDTDVGKRQAANWLISQGVHIISNSTSSVYGPMDGSGEEAMFVDRVVQGGVLWVGSSGNRADEHYYGVFTDTDGDQWHEFSPGDEMMRFEPNGKSYVVLNWDAWKEGDQDYDLYILDADGREFLKSVDVQRGSGSDAAEAIEYAFEDSGPYYIAIFATRITRPGVLNLFTYDASLEYISPEHSICTPGDAREAIAVGAVNWGNDQLEDYSSQGPTNDGRVKPDLTAPTNVSSAVFGRAWGGTSASAPHVSGAAALVMQAYPQLNVSQVREYLFNQSVDLGTTGPDPQFGFGRLRLGNPPPVGSALVPTPLQPTFPPSATTVATSTASINPTSTPIRVIGSSGTSSNDTQNWVILSLCVIAPGLIGLGGIGLLAGVLIFSRTRRTAYQARASPPLYPVEAAVKCPRCGGTHRQQAQFCPHCGFDLSSAASAPPLLDRCLYCGEPLRPTSKFCPRCGRRR